MDCRNIEKMAGAPWKVEYIDTVDSTNTLLVARTDAVHGQVIIAGRQTAGKGRQGRSFDSPAGSGLYMSLLWMPQKLDTRLTLAVGLAVAKALEEVCGLDIQLKWPNDILCGGRKLVGILTESRLGERIRIIAGVGINLLQQEEDFPEEIRHKAGSVVMCGGKCTDAEQIAARILANIRLEMECLEHSPNQVMDGCRRRLYGRGREVNWENGSKRGIITDISDDGQLLVQTADGEIALGAGETSVQGLY